MKLVIISDYKKETRISLSFSSTDIENAEKHLPNGDVLLSGLQGNTFFENRDTWDKLEPDHWEFLILKNLDMMSKAFDGKELSSDNENKIMNSLNFLILGYVICLEKLTNVEVEYLNINRIDDQSMVINMNTRLDSSVYRIKSRQPDVPKADKKKFDFKVVIDNTKE